MAEVISMPVNVATLPPEQKLEFIRLQILAVKAKERDFFLCPYCGKENYEGMLFCCAMFSEAATAVLDRMEKSEAIEFMQKAHDNAMRRVN